MTSTFNVINTISVVLLLLLARVNSTEKMILHLGVLVSQEGDVNLSGYIPAMNIALETINNDTTLPFEFRVAVNDSMVSRTYRQTTNRRQGWHITTIYKSISAVATLTFWDR